jgi:hypothetical protein
VRRGAAARRQAGAVVALLCALAAGPGAARELWSAGDAHLEVKGSLRQIFAGTGGTSQADFQDAIDANPVVCTLVATFPDCPAFFEVGETGIFTSLTRLRLDFDLRVAKWLSAVVVYDNQWLGGDLDTFEAQLGEDFATGSLLHSNLTVTSSSSFEWTMDLYRAYLLLETKYLEVTLGRQRVPWGVGRLWNPIDRFNAIPPLLIEADQVNGVDAVKARVLFSGFTFFEAVYAAASRGRDRAAAGRLHGVLWDTDYSLIAGVFDEAPTAGFDLATNLGDAAGRIEAVWAYPTRDVRPFGSTESAPRPNFWQVVVSIDYDLDVGNGLYLLAEYFYNGNALGFGTGKADGLLGFFQETDQPLSSGQSVRVVAPGSVDLFGGSRLVTNAAHLTGFEAGYDLTPELRGDLLVIVDWQGLSATFFPTLTWSPLGWLEIRAGVQASTGPHLSQYGNAKPLGFLQLEAFF